MNDYSKYENKIFRTDSGTRFICLKIAIIDSIPFCEGYEISSNGYSPESYCVEVMEYNIKNGIFVEDKEIGYTNMNPIIDYSINNHKSTLMEGKYANVGDIFYFPKDKTYWICTAIEPNENYKGENIYFGYFNHVGEGLSYQVEINYPERELIGFYPDSNLISNYVTWEISKLLATGEAEVIVKTFTPDMNLLNFIEIAQTIHFNE